MKPRTVELALVVVLLAGHLVGVPGQQPNPNSAVEQEFFTAVIKGNVTLVRELLSQQPTLIKATYKNGITPVLLAVYAHHPDIAEMFIATGIGPNFFEAAATGRVDRLKEFLKKNPELIRAWSPDGWTALHLNFNNLEVAKLLIDKGADINVNSRNKFNATPLQGAAASNRIALARLLLSRGANVNCRSEGGGSPLHEAAANGFLDFAKLLLDNGANVNQKDDSGKTPLAIALQYQKTELAQFLREHGGTE